MKFLTVVFLTGLALIATDAGASETLSTACVIGGRRVAFGPERTEGPRGVAIAELAPGLFAEFTDVWNGDTLSIISNGKAIASQSNLYGEGPLHVAVEVDGEYIECVY